MGNTGNAKVARTDVIKIVGDYVGANAVTEAGGILDDEEWDFMADRLEAFDSDNKEEVNITSLFVANRVDAFESKCNEDLTASAIFIAKISPARSVTNNDVGPSYDTCALSEFTKLHVSKESSGVMIYLAKKQ
ncbi:hypothetical protein Tco_0327825 [Tanacetum coccineum]